MSNQHTTHVLQRTAVCAAVLAATILMVSAAPNTTLDTTHGQLKGTVTQGVRRFVGIPFAKPPVGDLRFKPPVQADHWSGTRSADDLPNSCWQIIDTSHNQFWGVDMWNPNTPRSEDCLYLNAWIPDTPTPKKPIIVWIYGGGFYAGTSTLYVYDPTKLVAMNDVIVVSLNYRLGAFGFLYSGEDNAPGNVGLLDQVMAMQWVKDNAVRMGGDPDRITLMGESAGAASVGYHLLSPLSHDLFTYAVMMSASPLVAWGIKTHKESFSRLEILSQSVGCGSDRSETSKMMQCLRQVDANELSESQWTVVDDTYFDTPFAAVVDDHFIVGDQTTLLKENKAKNTSVIAGVVHDEGIYWLVYGFANVFELRDPNPLTAVQRDEVMTGILRQAREDTPAVKKFTDLVYQDFFPPLSRPSNLDAVDDASGDILFKCAVQRFASLYSSLPGKTKTYAYSFNHRLSSMPWPEYFGVAHGYEIEAFMGQPFLHPANYSDTDRAVSKTSMDYLVNFAHTGDPSKGPHNVSVEWPSYGADNKSERFVAIAANTSLENGLRHETCTFWQDGLPVLEELQKKASANQGCQVALPGVALLVILCAVLVWSGSVLPC